MKQDIILTGLPRSGTTLACKLLSERPNSVALNEPMRTATYRTYPLALAGVPDFFQEMRHSILTRKTAIARVVDGKMTTNHFANVKGQRKTLVRKQEFTIDKPLDQDFRLALKHNALFTILLADLAKNYPVFAFVRNPLSVLASWNTLSIPASRGVVRAAEWLYPNLTKSLSKIKGLTEKQLHILHWYCSSYAEHLPDTVIRYEDIISSNGGALDAIIPEQAADPTQLNSRNKNKVYDRDTMLMLGEKLLASDNACWEFYQKDEVEALLAELD